MSKSARTILITGANGNLGRAVAAAFAREGARLLLVGHDPALLESAFPTLAAGSRRLAVDLTDSGASARALDAAVTEAGGVDALCALAGGFRMGEKVSEIGDGALAAMMALNVSTLINTVRAVLPGMIERRRGRIVTVGAMGGLRGGGTMGAYAAAKSAVLRLTESLAAENGRHGITVNAVLPSIIDTPENRAAMPKADRTAWIAPADLAAVVRFLASDEASAVNGALIPITGRG